MAAEQSTLGAVVGQHFKYRLSLTDSSDTPTGRRSWFPVLLGLGALATRARAQGRHTR